MAKLGLLGMHLSGYGCAGRAAVDYGLAGAELEAGDSGLRTFVSVQGSLAMCAIYKWGSEEQKTAVAAADGPRRGDRLLRAHRAHRGLRPVGHADLSPAGTGTDWVLNGTKRWIGLATVAKVAVIWAMTDEGIRGFLVPTETPGFTATTIEPKLSMRASIQCEIDSGRGPVAGRRAAPEGAGAARAVLLPERGPLRDHVGRDGRGPGLLRGRTGLPQQRLQFDKPLAGYQLTQLKLVDMALEINKGFLLALHPGRLKDAGSCSTTRSRSAS